MEKVKVLFLKSPIIMGIITFMSAFILAMLLKSFWSIKGLSLEKTLVITAICTPVLYNYKFKEQMSKTYRLLYATTTTLLYVLLNIYIIYYSPEFSQSNLHNLFFNLMLFQSVVIFIGVYIIASRVGKSFSKYDFQKLSDFQKTLPKEIQKERRLKVIVILLILSLPWILLVLNNKNIINLGSNMDIILPLTFLLLLVLSGQYIKTTMPSYFLNNTSIENDEQKL